MRRRLPLSALIATLVAGAAFAGDPPEKAPPASTTPESTEAAPRSAPLLYLGLNDRGHEEWLRQKDHAIVIRIPGGDYQRRPYEGGEASGDAQPFPVPSFFIDKHEVTNAQFARFLNDAGTTGVATDGLVWPQVVGLVHAADGTWSAAPGMERHPVTAATGNGGVAYAKWVGGSIPRRPQWEKAAGGPDGRLYPWGDELPDRTRANFGLPQVAKGPMPVGSFPNGASPYGVLDMAGNVYDRVLVGKDASVIKGGSWVSPHALNLRVLDMCVQDMGVADRSVGFRCAMKDPEPDRAPRTAAEKPVLKLATDFDAAVEEAQRRRVPIFLTLLYDTCGQCDRTRAQLFQDPRFVAYCNANMVVILGHDPGDGFEDPHPPGENGACPLYPGLTCRQHMQIFGRGVAVVKTFIVTPGNFVMHPDRLEPGSGDNGALIKERELPKWGNPVDAYLQAFDRARKSLAESDAKAKDQSAK